MGAPTIYADRLTLHPLTVQFASSEYLHWLNDPDVLRYRDTASTTTWDEMVAWLRNEPQDSARFAITLGPRHIGNISLDGIRDETADLGIMLGAKDVWGKGYGREAITHLTRYGFETLGLKKITASSPNPSFNAIMRKSGWKHIGTSPKAFLSRFEELDIERWETYAPPF